MERLPGCKSGGLLQPLQVNFKESVGSCNLRNQFPKALQMFSYTGAFHESSRCIRCCSSRLFKTIILTQQHANWYNSGPHMPVWPRGFHGYSQGGILVVVGRWSCYLSQKKNYFCWVQCKKIIGNGTLQPQHGQKACAKLLHGPSWSERSQPAKKAAVESSDTRATV